MVMKQSLCALSALGFLWTGCGLALAKDTRGGGAYSQGHVLVHIESGVAGRSWGGLANAGAARSASNPELIIKVLDTRPASSAGPYRLRFFNNQGRRIGCASC
jgi:hypothetical protein